MDPKMMLTKSMKKMLKKHKKDKEEVGPKDQNRHPKGHPQGGHFSGGRGGASGGGKSTAKNTKTGKGGSGKQMNVKLPVGSKAAKQIIKKDQKDAVSALGKAGLKASPVSGMGRAMGSSATDMNRTDKHMPGKIKGQTSTGTGQALKLSKDAKTADVVKVFTGSGWKTIHKDGETAVFKKGNSYARFATRPGVNGMISMSTQYSRK